MAWILLKPAPAPALALSLTASPLVAGAPAPFTARIRAIDGQAHGNVRLRWHLPPGAEIIRAEPAVSPDGAVYFGELAAGQEFISHLVIRLFQSAGTSAAFGFNLAYAAGPALRERRGEVVGSENLPIVASALRAEVPEAFRADTAAPRNTIIPILVENRSDASLPYVQLEFDPPNPELGPRLVLGDLGARERRLVFVPLTPEDGNYRLRWIASSASRELTRGSWTASVADWPAPAVKEPLVSRPETPTTIFFEGVLSRVSLLVAHPLLSDPVQTFGLTEGQTSLRLPAPEARASATHDWLVVPLYQNPDGLAMLGPAVKGIVRAPFPFSSQVRYTTPSGDQLGAGPHPPQAGQETRYWVFWRVGPLTEEARDLRVSATLPRGVRATGNVTAPNDGDWEMTGNNVAWSLAALGPSVGSTEALFGFEISVKPQSDAAGRVLQLVGTSTASVRDAETGAIFEATDEARSSLLPEDVDKSGAGIVLP